MYKNYTHQWGVCHPHARKLLLMMKLTTFILLIGMLQISAATVAQKITLSENNASLAKVFKKISQQTGYGFMVEGSTLKTAKQVTINVKDAALENVLAEIFQGQPLQFVIKDQMVMVSKKEDLANNTFQNATPARKLPPPGRITGKIVDEKGQTLPGATVMITELNKTVISSVDGTYTIEAGPGSYTLEVKFIGYQPQRITEVAVIPGKATTLDIAMKVSATALSTVIVTSSFKKASVEGLYARQKNNAAVSDGITAEQISRTPDNNTAQVLKRISGLQVSDNKYVVIRGLSDRYNNVLLNGAQLPSSEPNRRNFAFDMVPSAILDRIVVNKTATPDLTGEFTGGLVQIETKDIPTENFVQLTLGSGFNTRSTGKEMLGLDRGKNAWIGFASDIHKKPGSMSFGAYSALEGKINNTTPATDPIRQQMHQFLKEIPDNWTLKKYTAMPTQNYQFQLGQVIPFKDENQLGVIAALTYRNEQDIEDRHLHNPTQFDYNGTANNYTTTLGGSLNLGYRFGKNKITLQNTYNRKFSDEMWKYTGIDEDNSNTRKDSYSDVTIISQLFQSQLDGEHTLSKAGIKVDWFASAGRMDRNQPYSRVMSRNNGRLGENPNFPPDYFSFDLADLQLKNGNLFYSELGEKIYNWAANVQVPFHLFNLGQTFKAGYQGKYRTADFGASLFRMYAFSDGSYPAGTPYEQVFTQENFGRDLYLHSVSGNAGKHGDDSADGYNGFQRLNAGYAMLDLKPLNKLRLIGGIRAERNDQNIYDDIWDEPTQTINRRLINNKQTDWLPSVNAIYSITSKLNFRAAWYKSVARPDFRELSSFAYWDYDLVGTVGGGPLQTTRISNADLRLEYYPAPGEVISVSGFYKKFSNPIEVLFTGKASYYYKNLESALDHGLEVDFRKSLNFVGSASPFWQNLYLSGNFTLLKASVSFYQSDAKDDAGNPVSPKRDRPLAGQSPYIINGGLLYAGKTFGLNLSYNRYGKRIVYASADRGQDEYEKPRDLVDLQASYKFLKEKRAEIKFNISDLLNQEEISYKNQFDKGNPFGFDPTNSSVERYPGSGEALQPKAKDPKGTTYNKDYDTVVRRYKFGSTYSINFIYRF